MKILIPLMLLICLAFFSCKKSDDNPAGKGGNATLKVIPKHHYWYVDSVMVYIKYNTKDRPSNDVYDDSAKCIVGVDTLPLATFADLKNGDYYLYGKGWDPNPAATNPNVGGGIPYSISLQSEQTINLAISEK